MSRSSRTEWACYVLSPLPAVGLVVACTAGLIGETLTLAVLSVSFIGLNLAHMAATWSRVFFDPRAQRGAWVERGLLPAALLLLAVLGEAVGFGALLLGVQCYLSLHHAMLQNYGIARATQRRTGRPLSALAVRLDQAACLLLPLGALTLRVREVSALYSGATLVAPPLWLAVLLMATGALALFAYLSRELRGYLQGQTIDPLGPALVTSQCLLWSLLLLLIKHPALPLYALASGHYAQYLYFVWRTEQQRPGLSALSTRVRAWVAPPERLRYLGALVGVGGLVVLGLTFVSVAARALASTAGLRPESALPIAPWVAAMIGVNLSHYWLDHRIWRTRPAPALALAGSL